MYTTQNGKLNHQLVFETFKDLLLNIRDKAANGAIKIQHINNENGVQNIECQDAPIDLLIDYEQRMKLKQISQAFLQDQYLKNTVAENSIYNYLLVLLGKQEVYTNLSFNISDSSLVLSELQELVSQEIK
ncbi:hypothetical protein, partial [Nostoc sp.]